MKRLVLLLLVTSIIVIPTRSFAAWWYESYIGQGKKEISDAEFQFRLGDITCVVEKTDFTRSHNDTIMESRLLTCTVSKGVNVTIRARCDYPRHSLTDIIIEKDRKKYWPALYCGPK
jgi:hypothetical protein